ncbi:MAG: hypothetical protein NWE90_00650, partial [Candidatus Bathyarchaeota archaeon]|nr:hypothetical protein [Candidatus Bathyarchaeota archaeon]
EGTKLQTIILRYSGPTAQDPWLETNGTAKHTFTFEKNTGLLISSSSTTEATSINGRRITTYDYQLDSTSFWTLEELPPQTSTNPTPTTVETFSETNIQENEEVSIIQEDYFVLILIVVIISIIAVALIEIKRNVLRNNHTSQDDISESKNLEQSEF